MTARLAAFVEAFDRLLEMGHADQHAQDHAATLLGLLVGTDDWLPEAQAQPDPQRYRQYLLPLDPGGRYSVVSFVWGPGQATPIHDHRVWGLVGMLRGSERDQRFIRERERLRADGPARLLLPGDVARLSPAEGDIHRVSNVYDDRVSISIHVYGGDIGTIRRATYDAGGTETPFVSAYADVPPPRIIP